MKFYHVLHGEVDVDRVVFDPYPLADRECMNCKSKRFFRVEVLSEDDRVQRWSAMCEGCKRIVELQ